MNSQFFDKLFSEITYERINAMNLLYFPDEYLSNPCRKITHFDSSLKEIIAEMKNHMSYHKGLGLTANQVGYGIAVMIVKDKKDVVHEFINPQVIETDGSISMSEGCLSAPSIFLEITRPSSVLLQYQDITGEIKQVMAEGIEARCILHEMEHINGESFMKNVNRTVRKIALSKLKKYLKNNVA